MAPEGFLAPNPCSKSRAKKSRRVTRPPKEIKNNLPDLKSKTYFQRKYVMAPEGFEPPTPGFLLSPKGESSLRRTLKVQCSNQAELQSHHDCEAT